MNRLKCEFRDLNVLMATAVAAIFIFVDFSVWCALGSPIYILRFVSCYVPTLPLWVFGLLDFISYALLGFSLGAILSTSCPVYDVHKYRGAFYFAVGVTLAFLHHVFFFSGAGFFAALFIVLLQCLFLSIALINFYRVSKLASIIAALGVLWSFYLFVLNFMTFFFM